MKEHVRAALVKKYTERMERIALSVPAGVGFEQPHVDADELLCELLRELGFGAVVELYNGIERYYAYR